MKKLFKKAKGLFKKTPKVGVVYLEGIIGGAGGFRKKSLNLKAIDEELTRAFDLGGCKAVGLIINSPGGSPVQSDLIARRVASLSKQKNIPVYAFCQDVAASGGYWLACCADKIYARPSSVIGSIGVISAGFGFPELLEKLGIERRVYTSGTSKSQLDPFSPEKPEDIVHLKALQEDIHEQFKQYVRTRRGERLKGAEETLFTGSFWTGEKALDYGLIDGLEDMETVFKEKLGKDVKFVAIKAKKQGIISSLLKAEGRNYGTQMVEATLTHIEDKSLWQRFGL